MKNASAQHGSNERFYRILPNQRWRKCQRKCWRIRQNIRWHYPWRKCWRKSDVEMF